jgi:hypothetical protein
MFLVTNGSSCESETKSPIDKEFVIESWTMMIQGLNDTELDDLNDLWPNMFMINGSVEQLQKWLVELSQNNQVGDTEETLCWAIAETKELAMDLLKLEMAK